MKVGELITYLQQFDPDMPIVRRALDGRQMSDIYPQSFEEAVARPLLHAPGVWLDVSKTARGEDLTVLAF